MLSALVLTALVVVDPRPTIVDAYKAFGLDVTLDQLVEFRRALDGKDIGYRVPSLGGLSTVTTYTEYPTPGFSQVQINSLAIGSSRDSDFLPPPPYVWSSREVAESRATGDAERMTLPFPTQTRGAFRAGQDADIRVGFTMIAMRDYVVDGYKFLDPQVGIQLNYGRSGSLEMLTRVISPPPRETVPSAILTQAQARARVESRFEHPSRVKADLGWRRTDNKPARLTYWFMEWLPGTEGRARLFEVDAVSGEVKLPDQRFMKPRYWRVTPQLSAPVGG